MQQVVINEPTMSNRIKSDFDLPNQCVYLQKSMIDQFKPGDAVTLMGHLMPKYEDKKVQGRLFREMTSSIIVHEIRHLQSEAEEQARDNKVNSKISASTTFSLILDSKPINENDLDQHKRFINCLLDHEDLRLKYLKFNASIDKQCKTQ